MKRFYSSGDVEEPADAVGKLMEQIKAIPSIETMNDVSALHDRVWCRETDTVVKTHIELLKKVYERYSGANNLPGQPRTMSMSEWNNLVDRAELVDTDKGYSERESKQAYGRAIMSVVNEMSTDKHRSANLVEFVEALLRVADVKH